MIQDLHSHTYYSFCGKDEPTKLIETMIKSGIEMFGITDHSYGIAKQRACTFCPDDMEWRDDYQRSLNQYIDLLHILKDKYKEKINIKCGIEIPTFTLPSFRWVGGDITEYDYCLLEHIDHKDSAATDLFKFVDNLGCPCVGIAHTDLSRYINDNNINALDFFTKMAEHNIFWELNVNMDSIHNYKEHLYVEHFFADENLQDVVLKSGMKMSVGFDGHRVEEYDACRVKKYCKMLEETGIPFVFDTCNH